MIRSRTIKALSGGLGLACFLLLLCSSAQAQLAPTPQKAPRTPVKREALSGNKAPLPASRLVSGQAVVLDSERLKINDIEMRLFGVVPPQLSASFGPQARGVVDALAQGEVTCRIRDRDRDGRYLASCRNESDADFGIELLRRGLAVTARGTLRPTELSRPYIAAEEAAKDQRLGLWSVSLPKAATESAIREAAQKAEAGKKEKAKLTVEETPQDEAPKTEDKPAAPPPAVVDKKETANEPAPAPAVTALASTPSAAAGESANKLSLSPTADDIQALLNAPPLPAPEEKGFIEKYQMMIVGFLALATALVWATASALMKAKDKRDELRALAAALRGEMMAARAVCLARLAKIANDKDEKAVSWPRIRSLVFQAYVGQLGRLGAELSRQIASVYGQASDYASYYVGAEAKPDVASKRQSLQTLVQHIEDVVPRLAEVEQKGAILRAQETQPLSFSLFSRVVRPASLTAPTTHDDGGPGRPTSLPAPESGFEEKSEKPEEKISSPQTEAKKPEEAEKARDKTEEKKEEKKEEKTAAQVKEKSVLAAAFAAQQKASASSRVAAGRRQAGAKSGRAKPRTSGVEKTTAFLVETIRKIDIAAPLGARIDKLKDMASAGWQRLHPQPYEDIIPDYANLTDEELEALAYDTDELFAPSEPERHRKTG